MKLKKSDYSSFSVGRSWLSIRDYLLVIVTAFLGQLYFSTYSYASSEAGIDITCGAKQVRVLYSVALDYGEANEPIRDPKRLLFEVIAFLQERPADKKTQQVTLQFELYQSSHKEGNYLSFVLDPFEGGNYTELFDGRASQDLDHQVISLLNQYTNASTSNQGHRDTIRLYKCTDRRICRDILFGSFPSANMHTGYCVEPLKGCSANPIAIKREAMPNYFSAIP